MQAFGQTQKRFMKSSEDLESHKPGPSEYQTSRDWKHLSTGGGAVKQNGKKVTNYRYKAGASAAFKSTTKRTVLASDKDPRPASYDSFKPFGCDKPAGGSPNNFLLLKNDKMAAPFGSTVKKGWLTQ